MTAPLVKVTEFVGEASGDCECFCFDRRTDEQQTADRSADYAERAEREHEARLYPNELLPEGCRVDHRGIRGRWRVTVEFWPGEKAAPPTVESAAYPEVTTETLRWLSDAGMTTTMLKFLAVRHFLSVRLEKEPLDVEMDLNPHLQIMDVAKKVVRDVLGIGASVGVRCNVEDVLLLWVTDMIDERAHP